MFRVEKYSGNRIEIEISGKITAEEMKKGLDDLISKSRETSNGRMRYLIHDLDLPSPGAIALELSRLPSLFGLVRRFRRVALIADRHWIRKAGELEGMLIPGLEVKAFEMDEKPAAEAWLGQ